MVKTSVFRKLIRIVKFAVLIFFTSSILVALVYRFVNPPITPLMVIRISEQLFSGEKLKLKKDWVSLEKISPNLVQAVVASEDNNFLEHHGFDFDAIQKAADNNKKGKRIKGASTISQQTAKNVYLWPDRSWIRKGFEAYFTLLDEFFWGKRRTMEVYLNVIEMGDGIYGAEMAAQTYFHKPAKKLSRSEAALIAAVLPNPRRWSPARPSPYIQRKQQWILVKMDQIGPVNLK